MLRSYGSFIEHLAWFERPIPPLLATSIFSPSPYRAQFHTTIRTRQPDARYFSRRVSRSDVPKNTRSKSTCAGPNIWHDQNATELPQEPVTLVRSEDTKASDPKPFSDPETTFNFTQRPDPAELEKQRLALFEEDDPEYDAVLGSQYSKNNQGNVKEAGGSVATPEARCITQDGASHWTKPDYQTFPLPQDWNEAYGVVSQLITEYELSVGRSSLVGRLTYSERMSEWVQQFEDHIVLTQDASSYWKGLTQWEIHARWHPMMLHFILQEPAHLHLLMHTLVLEYEAPTALITGIATLIARIDWVNRRADQDARRRFGKRRAIATKQDSTSFWDTLVILMRRDESIPYLDQKTLQQALQLLPYHKLEDALRTLHDYGFELPTPLSLAMARKFADHKDMTNALRQLDSGLSQGADKSTNLFETTVAKLVRSARRAHGEGQGVQSTVARLFDMNIQLAIPAWNCLILNAMEDGDSDTAWNIFHMLPQHNVEPDDYTYCIMLKMVREQGDRRRYRELYHRLKPENKMHLTTALTTELLQCWYDFSGRDGFGVLFRFYERQFDLQPLRDLGIIQKDYKSAFEGWYPSPRPMPSSEALVVTMLKYIKAQRRVRPIYRTYLNFLAELNRGNPVMIDLASTDHIWNGFFKAFSGMSSFTEKRVYSGGWTDVLNWTEMLRTMTRNPPADAINPMTGKKLERLKPSLQTWNILLNAHARAGNASQVHRITANMKDREMPLDIVSYNSILGGFARFQHIGLVCTILQQMKDARISPDKRTAEALAHLNNREGLVHAMRQLGLTQLPLGLQKAARAASGLVRKQDVRHSSDPERGLMYKMKQAKLKEHLREWKAFDGEGAVWRYDAVVSPGRKTVGRGKAENRINVAWLQRAFKARKTIQSSVKGEPEQSGWREASGRSLFEADDKQRRLQDGPVAKAAESPDIRASPQWEQAQDMTLFEPDDDERETRKRDAEEQYLDDPYSEISEGEEIEMNGLDQTESDWETEDLRGENAKREAQDSATPVPLAEEDGTQRSAH